MPKWLRRTLWTLGGLFLGMLLLYFFRVPILQGIGEHLITESPTAHGGPVFVLGGDPQDRGKKAASLYHAGKVPKLICVGGNVPEQLQLFGIDSCGAALTGRVVEDHGVPSHEVERLRKGTSTLEEAIACLEYARENGLDSAIVVSDKFHLRRVRYVFDALFEKSGTTLLYRGAASSEYDEKRWWRSEQGMIMVNNEYMKLLYYRCFKKDPRRYYKERIQNE